MANVKLYGETSGFVQLAAPSAAGNNTITLPTTGTELVAADSSGTVTFAPGASGTPSIAVNNDANTGIYFPAADTIGFVEGGNEAVRIDSSGRLGIGTTSPDQALTVQGVLSLKDSSGAGVGQLGSIGSTFRIQGQSGANLPLTLWTSDSERARIDTSGRLLVGTTTGTSKLSIAGTANNANSEIQITATGVASGYIGSNSDGLNIGTDTAGLVFKTGVTGGGSVGGSGTERMRITSGGQIAASSDGSATAPAFTRSSDLDTGLYFIDSNELALTTGGTQRFLVTNVGAVLHTFGVTSNEGYTYNNTISGTTYIIDFRTTNTTRGNITVSDSAVAYNTSSDYRLKENVTLLTGATDRLKQLPVHRFNFIADPSKTVDGFIAHEVQTVVPEAITGEKDAVDDEGNPVYQGIDQSKLVPLLTAALQEAIAKIETLEAANASLEARLTSLEVN